MNRLQFLILTSLSGVIAFCILFQIVFVRMAQADELRLKQTEESLQQGQLFLNHLQQIASRVAQVAQQQQDQNLKDLLTRQGIQFRPPANSSSTTPASAPAPAATTPSTH